MKKKDLKVIKFKTKKNYSYKRKVIINDLTLLISVGIHDFEKIKKQEVRFNIDIEINPSLFPSEKRLNSIVNYEIIIKSITKITKNKHYELLETLAEDDPKREELNKTMKECQSKIEDLIGRKVSFYLASKFLADREHIVLFNSKDK